MDIQAILVVFVIVGAIMFGGVTLTRRVRAFSAKKSCDADCGCDSSKSK